MNNINYHNFNCKICSHLKNCCKLKIIPMDWVKTIFWCIYMIKKHVCKFWVKYFNKYWVQKGLKKLWSRLLQLVAARFLTIQYKLIYNCIYKYTSISSSYSLSLILPCFVTSSWKASYLSHSSTSSPSWKTN